jgi:hypothetical protein
VAKWPGACLDYVFEFMFLALELCLTAIAVAIAYTYPQLGDRWFAAIERSLTRLANRRLLAVLTIGLLAIGLRLALLPILPIPVPEVHDEYSHLLLADTLAHGRLANPTHPMWIHFETFHVNWHPAYASMYYPGHALFLAFGQVVLGNPFWGVLLSSGLMCAAICWALQGWMPPEWALLGAFLAVIRLGTFSYWANSYWGGTVSALGGALVLGAFPRIKSRRRPRDGFLLGLGMAILAITRPYEGIFFCVPVAVALLVWASRQKDAPLKTLLARIAVPATLTLLIGLAWLGYYFWRVTGSPFTTPYQVNIRTYGLVYFPWQKITPVPEFHHAAMQRFYRGHSIVGLFNFARQHNVLLQLLKAVVIWLFYFGPLLSMPWILWLATRRRGRFYKSFTTELRLILLLCLTTYLSIVLTIYVGQPHYAGPMAAALYVATLLVMRDVYITRAGRFLTRTVPLIALVLFFAKAATPAIRRDSSWVRIWCTSDWQNLERSRILEQLEHTPGQHLVIVRYRASHDFVMNEWVFNGADINNSKVVWARDMGTQNTELLQYFKNRKVWLAEPDSPVKLTPYAE